MRDRSAFFIGPRLRGKCLAASAALFLVAPRSFADPASPTPAAADSAPEVQLEGSAEAAYGTSYTPSPSAKTSDRIVMPSGHLELGGEMTFITSDGYPGRAGDGALDLTDVGLLRLRARRSFSDWLELYAATNLLAKQPTATRNAVFQGGLFGARAAVEQHVALGASGSAGPLLAQTGWWWQAAPSIDAKLEAGHSLRFVLDAEVPFTAIDVSEPSTEQRWLAEAGGGAEADLGDHSGALWVRLDYFVPFARSRVTGFDPQVRLDLQVGGVLSLSEGWDAFASYTFIDRGELARPETTLPILDGGFDQRQLTLGVEYRFDPKRPYRRRGI